MMEYSKNVRNIGPNGGSPYLGTKTNAEIRSESALLVAKSKLLVKQTSAVTRASSEVLKKLKEDQQESEIYNI